MKPSPPGWPRVSASVYYDDASTAIDWLCTAFGFTPRLVVTGDGGEVIHAELEFGDDGLVMVASAGERNGVRMRGPRSGDGTFVGLCVYVDDVDAHHTHAVAQGARVHRPLTTTDYGVDYWTDRSYGCYDPEGHQWYFCQRLR